MQTMKITNNTISIRESAFAGSKAAVILKGLSVGDSASAKIIARLSGNEAMINIGGKEMHAIFKNGVPPYNFISLVLDKRQAGQLFFSINNKAEHLSALNSLLKPYTVFKQISSSPAAFQKYLASGGASLFELNRMLIGADKLSGTGLAGIFEALAKKNIPRLEELVAYINDIMQQDIPQVADAISGRSGRQKNGQSQKEKQQNAATELIEEIFSNIDNEDEAVALAAKLMELTVGDAQAFELPFWDGEKYSSLFCICGEEGWIFNAEFSKIGRVEILAKKTEAHTDVNIYAESASVVEQLETNRKQILEKINSSDVILSFHNFGFLHKKMLALKDELAYTVTFDTKV